MGTTKKEAIGNEYEATVIEVEESASTKTGWKTSEINIPHIEDDLHIRLLQYFCIIPSCHVFLDL